MLGPLRRARAIVVVAAATLAVTPVAADAAAYRGKTGQGRFASVVTDDDGRVRSVAISWIARCRGFGTRFADVTRFPAPLRSASETAFADGGTYAFRERGGLVGRVTVALRGERLSEHAWRGTFYGSVVVRRRGRVVDRCHLGTVRWAASIPFGRLDMTSDNRDYIGGGQSYSYRTPLDSISVRGTRRFLGVSMGDWTLEFQPPTGRDLVPGRFTGATRYPFNGREAGLSVSGHGRGCNQLTGEFTVHSSSFDAHGAVRAIDISFVQHCEGGPPALRGRVVYSR